jgi:hypothetical protein
MIYCMKEKYIIQIHKSKKASRYERYIYIYFLLLINIFPFTNYVFEFVFSNNDNWHVIQQQISNILLLKWIYTFVKKIYIILYIIEGILYIYNLIIYQ